MSVLFPADGMSATGITFFLIQIVSLLVLCLLLFEFWRIHAKRIELLRGLGMGQSLRKVGLERTALSFTYVLTTITVILLPLLLYT